MLNTSSRAMTGGP